MRPPRFSLAALLAFVAFCGVAFAALHSPSYLWANTLFTVALGAILLAGINVLFSVGSVRAFWAGFFIVGGTYFGVCSLPVWPRLLTEAVLDFGYPLFAPAQPANSRPFPIVTAPPTRWDKWTESDRTNGVGYPIGTFSLVSSLAFRQIGHSLFTLLFAALGGAYARFRYACRAGISLG